MAFDKRILMETLLEAAAKHRDATELPELSERIRAATLLNSSHSPESCARAIDFAYGEKGARQGLMVGGLPISDAFERLAQRDIPAGLAAREPELTVEEWRAAMLVISQLLRAFEHGQARTPTSKERKNMVAEAMSNEMAASDAPLHIE